MHHYGNAISDYGNAISGHIYLQRGRRGDVWCYRGRLPHEQRRALGPAWTGRGRPPAEHYTKRTAQAALDEILADARRGTVAGRVKAGATFEDAAREWLRYIEHDRGRKPSTVDSYTSTVEAFLIPAFGEVPVEQVTTAMIERWRERMLVGRSPRTVNRMLTELHGVFERARKLWKLQTNPCADVEKYQQQASGDLAFYSPEEVLAQLATDARGSDS